MPSWAAAKHVGSFGSRRNLYFQLAPPPKKKRAPKGRARAVCEEARRGLKRPWLAPLIAGQSGKEDETPLALAPQSEGRVA
eukprot:6423631-Pyramimonas_sp.AAC.1